jgi:hypothetical protein
MPEISEAALQTLRDSLGDVHYRANRLHEWREFGIVLNRMQVRFDILRQRSESTKNFDDDDKRALRDTLRAFQDNELIDVGNFIASAEHIRKPLTQSANGGGTTLALEAWLQKLEQTTNKVEEQMNDENWGEFRTQIREISKQLSSMAAQRQRLLENEIGDLRSFSRALRDQLNKN